MSVDTSEDEHRSPSPLPRGPLSLLPGFRPPTRPRGLDPMRPEDSDPSDPDGPNTPATGSPADPGYPGGLDVPRLARNGSSTGTSDSPSDREARKLTPQLAVGLLGIGFAIAAWAVGSVKRTHRLREPDKDQLREIGQPLGRILARHVPVEWLNADLVDATMAAAATGNYLNDGPVLVPRRPDAGVPANLTQETS